MNVKRVFAVSLFAQIFNIGSRLIVVPIYLKLLGIEAYGLVGLFMLFTSMLQLLNFGIGSTTLREMSRMKGGAAGSSAVRAQLRQSVAILSAISFAFAAIVSLLAPKIGTEWLHVSSIPVRDVSFSLRLMATAAAVAFVTNIFRSGLYGMEKQISVNVLSIFIGGLRSFGVIPVLVLVARSPIPFSFYQLVVSALELILMQQMLYRALPPSDGSTGAASARSSEFWRFAGGIAFTDLVWATVFQVDRIVLSTALPLAQYGYFTILYNAAYAVLMLFSPVVQVMQPRFSLLAAEGRHAEMTSLYFKLSYGVSVAAFSAAGMLIVFPEQIIFAWTGSHLAANAARVVLPLYAFSNGLTCVILLPYLLQFALGNIRMHVIGHSATAAFYLPVAVFLGIHFGALGTGCAWLGHNAAYLLLIVPFIHARVLPKMHLRWLMTTIAPGIALPLSILFLLSFIPMPAGRWSTLIVLGVICTFALGTSLAASTEYRNAMKGYAAIAKIALLRLRSSAVDGDGKIN